MLKLFATLNLESPLVYPTYNYWIIITTVIVIINGKWDAVPDNY